MDLTNYDYLFDLINTNKYRFIYDKTINDIYLENDIYYIRLSYDYDIDKLLILMKNSDVLYNIKYLYDKYRVIGFNDDIIHKILKYINFNLQKENIIYDDIIDYIEDKSIYKTYIGWNIKYQCLYDEILNKYNIKYRYLLDNMSNENFYNKVKLFDLDEYIETYIIDQFHICFYHEKIDYIMVIFKIIYNNDKYDDKYYEFLNLLFNSNSKIDIISYIIINKYYKSRDINRFIDYYKNKMKITINNIFMRKEYAVGTDLSLNKDKSLAQSGTFGDNYEFSEFIFNNILNIDEIINNKEIIQLLINKKSYITSYILNHIIKNNLCDISDNEINKDLLNLSLNHYIDKYEINELFISYILVLDEYISYELCIKIIKQINIIKNLCNNDEYNKINEIMINKMNNYNEILDKDYRYIIKYLDRFNKERIDNEIYDEYLKEIDMMDEMTENILGRDLIKIIHGYYK